MSTAFRTGDTIALSPDGAEMEVVTYRMAGTRQIITARTAAGELRTVVVDLDRIQAGGASVVVPPIDPVVARNLALDVLGGHRSRMPVTTEANLLAAAVVLLTGGAAP